MAQVGENTLPSTGSPVVGRGTNEYLALLIRYRCLAASGSRCDPARARRHQERVRKLKGWLWKRLEPHVRHLARGFAGRWGELDDLVQEAFLRFNTVITSYDPGQGAKVWTWLCRIFRNQFIGQLRKLREASAGDALDSAPQPDGPDKDLAKDLWETVDALLPDDHNRDQKVHAFRLYWTEGWTIEELRKMFGTPSIATAHRWLNEVADALRERLPQTCPCLFEPGEHLARARRLMDRRKFAPARVLLQQVAERLPNAEPRQREEARRLVAETLVGEAAGMLQLGRKENALALLEALFGAGVPTDLTESILSMAHELAGQFGRGRHRPDQAKRVQELVTKATCLLSQRPRTRQKR